VLWAVFEWWMFLHEQADSFDKNYRKDFQTRWDSYTETEKKAYGSSYKDYVKSRGFPPEIGKHKAQFTMWMMWWWVSMTWFVTGRALKKFWNFAYTTLNKMLTRMSDAVFAGRFTELK
jgi:hypothetical protein